MNGLEVSQRMIAERERASSVDLSNPIRRHDAQGIGSEPNMGIRKPTPLSEAANASLEFVMDCCDPDGYAHALPAEVIKRAARISAMMRPKEPVCAVGYGEPPPARCEFCDES